MAVQLELFPETETERLTREVSELKSEMGRLRKGMFARHTELERLYVQMYELIEKKENE